MPGRNPRNASEYHTIMLRTHGWWRSISRAELSLSAALWRSNSAIQQHSASSLHRRAGSARLSSVTRLDFIGRG
ncbi:hypothetical protein J1614_005326 [Plenodomus biglobosus]|nr:hypothetical protein J1614_005326 [Plenodomus biglobosus]